MGTGRAFRSPDSASPGDARGHHGLLRSPCRHPSGSRWRAGYEPDEVQRIKVSSGFRQAAACLDSDYDRFVRELITLNEIPAPPFKEQARGTAYLAMLKDAGLTDVERDAEGNVMGIWKGTRSGGSMLAVLSHFDTVFPEGTDVHVKRKGTRLEAPGIGDDTRARSTAPGKITADVKLIGDRPSGTTGTDTMLMQTVTAVVKSYGLTPSYETSSTDANIPISMGIPAVTIGRGGPGGRGHSVDEWTDVEKKGAVQAAEVTVAILLANAGLPEQ